MPIHLSEHGDVVHECLRPGEHGRLHVGHPLVPLFAGTDVFVPTRHHLLELCRCNDGLGGPPVTQEFVNAHRGVCIKDASEAVVVRIVDRELDQEFEESDV